jgi:hypothetical protein
MIRRERIILVSEYFLEVLFEMGVIIEFVKSEVWKN